MCMIDGLSIPLKESCVELYSISAFKKSVDLTGTFLWDSSSEIFFLIDQTLAFQWS